MSHNHDNHDNQSCHICYDGISTYKCSDCCWQICQECLNCLSIHNFNNCPHCHRTKNFISLSISEPVVKKQIKIHIAIIFQNILNDFIIILKLYHASTNVLYFVKDLFMIFFLYFSSLL